MALDDESKTLEDMAAALEASGKYKVLRRVVSRPPVPHPPHVELKKGIFLDVETTGLFPERDEIIELAMVPFTFATTGEIYEVQPSFQGFHQPRLPISAEITALTGITNEMVTGHVLDSRKVEEMVRGADLILAHNADFDRRFAENFHPCFVPKPWACSMSQIDWRAEGFEGTKLGYLVMGKGFFYDRHRAENDCLAALELLTSPLPASGVNALSQLLARAELPTWRIWAQGAPFDLKDLLKARGYRWNAEANRNPRAWYIDVGDEALPRELTFLRSEIFRKEVDLPMRKITAYERFSVRA